MSQQTIEAAAPAATKTMPRIRVSAAYLRLAATCRATLDIRYYLTGILVEPRKQGGCILVGTDGHHLIAIIDPAGECSESTIIAPNRATIAACPKVNPFHRGEQEVRTIEVEGVTALAVSDDKGLLVNVQPREAIIEGKFPDLQRVLPAWDRLQPGSPQQINPIYRNAPLAAISAGKMPGVQSYIEPGRDILVQRWSGMDNVVHIVMSQRVHDAHQPWIDLWSTVKAVAP